ncbi:MAG TPA: hypothetical protein VLC98_09825 [Phnomibacter sp.]|nr:hypothetical protein [Phnomibacter sp.]
MNNVVIILSLLSIAASCRSDAQTKPFKEFKKEISEEAFSKIVDNSPYPITGKHISDYKYYPYFELFDNSGVCVQFNISNEAQNEFSNRLKNYEYLNKDLIEHDDSSYVYVYDNIKIPEVTEEFSELNSNQLKGNPDVEVYLIGKGKLTDVFVAQSKNTVYNYTMGIYYYKKFSKLIYWFLVYK